MSKVPCAKGVDTATSRGCQSQGGLGLTVVQKDVLQKLLHDRLSPAQIAIKRNCSRQAIFKIIKKLQNKGLINKHFQGGVDKGGLLDNPLYTLVNPGTPSLPVEKGVRLHGQAWKIRILHKDSKYKRLLKRSSQLVFDSNTVMLYDRQIIVYSGHSFISSTVEESTQQSVQYLEGLLRRLESEFSVVLLKARSQNILQVKAHYAEMGNELAIDAEKKAYKIRIHTTEDGLEWFHIDNSFNFREAETVHPRTAKEDMQSGVRPLFTDLRDYVKRGENPPKLSEIMVLIQQVVKINKETAAGLNGIVNLLNPQGQKTTSPEGLQGRPDYIG